MFVLYNGLIVDWFNPKHEAKLICVATDDLSFFVYGGVFLAFFSVIWQMPGYNSQRRGTARTVPN